ncbi:hypothetical protein CDIMF43_220117 [Carnobacterium divergens]|nr:hypothetical protein CDIMF43_220117 [Carnobacterium divergens]
MKAIYIKNIKNLILFSFNYKNYIAFIDRFFMKTLHNRTLLNKKRRHLVFF